jgi:tripeptide aminopeptidase
MPDHYKYTVEERFLRYARVDTQSDPESPTQPSTAKQLDLSRILIEELQQIGVADAQLDEYGYVYATIPSNSEKNVPVICLCAHVDTSPDSSGANVEPLVHRSYDGNDIVLPKDLAQVIRTNDHPYLLERKGDDIITASGNTLLGADDKAGVAVIMDAANYLVSHPEIKHGAVRILFTPDEEIGRGVDKVNMEKLGAKFGYTLDGGERGSFEDETFSADAVFVTINGVSAHPGYAQGKMVSALKIAAEFIDSLPKDSYSPETTIEREGFIHPVKVKATIEQATVEFIIRDFHTHKLHQYENFLRDKLEYTMSRFPGATFTFNVVEQYRNMKEILDQHPEVSDYAVEAMERLGIKVTRTSVRGGTDGSRLSFMDLPCPNIFTGEMAFHGKHEYVSVQDMQKSVDVCVELLKIWEEKS